MNFLNHPAINKAYIAELLYGKKSTTNTSKLHQKIRGEKSFTSTEVEKLEEIKKQIKQEL